MQLMGASFCVYYLLGFWTEVINGKKRFHFWFGCGEEMDTMWERVNGENFQLKHLRFFNFPIFRTNPPSYFTQRQQEREVRGRVVELHLDLDFDFVIISFLQPPSSLLFHSLNWVLLLSSCCSCCILTTTTTFFSFWSSFYILFYFFTLTNGSSFKMRENQWTAQNIILCPEYFQLIWNWCWVWGGLYIHRKWR